MTEEQRRGGCSLKVVLERSPDSLLPASEARDFERSRPWSLSLSEKKEAASFHQETPQYWTAVADQTCYDLCLYLNIHRSTDQTVASWGGDRHPKIIKGGKLRASFTLLRGQNVGDLDWNIRNIFVTNSIDHMITSSDNQATHTANLKRGEPSEFELTACALYSNRDEIPAPSYMWWGRGMLSNI